MSIVLKNILDTYKRMESILLGVGNVIENGNVYSYAIVAKDKGEMSYKRH